METRQPSGSSPSGGWRLALWPVLLVVAVVAVYAPSASNGFVYDDRVLILDPDPPESVSAILHVFTERHWAELPYYRPVPRATMVAQRYLSGESPGPYHLFNTFVMALTALAAYGLFRTPKFGLAPIVAFLGAAFFALHPIASTTVYPIASGRETLIPALFVIAAVWAFLRPGIVHYALAIAFFALALLSKEQAVVLPVIFLLADVLGLTSRSGARSVGAWIARYAPVAIVVAVYLGVRASLFGGGGEHRFVLHENLLGPLQSVIHALWAIVNPSIQLVYEPRWELWFGFVPIAVVLVPVIALAAWAALRWSAVRSPALFWIGWFLVALAPTANVFHQESRFADRYVFLGLLGAIGLLLSLVGASWDRPGFRTKAIVAGIVLIIASGAVSFQRAAYYQNELSFLEQWVRSDPQSAKAHHGLGQFYYGAQQFDRAREEFEQAVMLQPNYPSALNNLGSMLLLIDQPEAAAHQFRQAIQFDPNHALAHNNLARILEESGDLDQAESLYLRSLEIDPASARVHAALGGLYLKKDDLEQAVRHLDDAVRLDPTQARLHYTLGQLWLRRGDKRRAEFHFDRSVLIEPGYAPAQNDLGTLLALRQKFPEAKLRFEHALRLDPNYVEAHLNYGNILAGQGDLIGAQQHLEEAERLDPDSRAVRRRLESFREALATRDD